MALNNEDKKDVKNAMGKAIANKVSKVTHDSPNSLSGSEKDKLRKKFGHNHLSGSEMDNGRQAKSKAIHAKTEGKKGGFDYDGMMKDVHKQFPGLKVNGKSPYKDEHKK